MRYILLNELEKPKFDMYIEGSLLDSQKKLIPNIFGKGYSLKKKIAGKYFVKVDEKYSLIGKLRDNLLVKIHNASYLFVVSPKVEKLFAELFGEQIEFYPLQITFNQQDFSDYKIVNVINKIDCVNYEQSEITFESYNDDNKGEGEMYGIESLVFDESAIPPNLNIFLLGRTNKSIIVVHERVKRKIEELSLSGFVLCLPENFSI